MTKDYHFDEKVSISLRRDEAIVLLWYLSRELWNADAARLQGSFEHPAEIHSLHAVLQELIVPLTDAGSPGAKGIEHEAREHLVSRFQ